MALSLYFAGLGFVAGLGGGVGVVLAVVGFGVCGGTVGGCGELGICCDFRFCVELTQYSFLHVIA